MVSSVAETTQVVEYTLKHATVFTVKNRYDPGYDGRATAGYKDANMQLTSDVLTRSPFENFVFELQIIMSSFLPIKLDDGHKRYVKCRNLRGDRMCLLARPTVFLHWNVFSSCAHLFA